jgi:hypothetical protein
MGAASRRKGQRREREAARLLGGQRVPLSGSAGGQFAGDVALANGWRVECKSRAEGFALLYRWIERADVLALKAGRREWLAVVRLDTLVMMLKAAGREDGR